MKLLSLLICAALSPADALFAQSIEMHRIDIIDDQGLGQHLVAASFLAPVGWTAQGFAAWPGKTIAPCKPTPTLVFQAVSPDKTTGVQVFPGQTWLFSPNASFAEQLRKQQSSAHAVTHCEVRPARSTISERSLPGRSRVKSSPQASCPMATSWPV